ncbi:FMRFamide receptor-like [Brachionus plicatilis]|uniref:FMRFamide receptor-like n=1 Tax=Brachionus plicatilis TaxID=10195 RepID=A0A3M7QF61_BRAPC|nr:FMRFamide receptor-like [Brachionus plicatilis]
MTEPASSKNEFIKSYIHPPITLETYEDYLDPKFPSCVTVLLLIIGLFGNFLSALVFNQKPMKKNSTFIYLGVLCYVDILVLFFGLGDIILITYFKFVIRNQSILMCRLHTFLTYSSTHLSSFIIASVSVDRAIATNFIGFAKFYCTQRTAHRIILLLCIVSVLINMHTLFFLGYHENYFLYFNSTIFMTNKTACYCASLYGTNYDKFMNPYFQWLDLIFYAILPFIVMLLSTFFILRVIFMSNKRIESKLSRNSFAFLRANGATETTSEDTRPKNTLGTRLRKSFIRDKANSGRNYNYRLNKTLHLTYTLVSINALFICLVGPLALVLIVIKGKEKVTENKLLFNILYILAYSNHSFNFIFYGLSSPPYRNAIKNLMHRQGKRSNASWNTSQPNRNRSIKANNRTDT